MGERYTIGPYVLDVEGFTLSRDAVASPTQPKVLELLILLARRRGDLVERAEILATLWPDLHVSENSLPQVVHKLRDLLGDHASLIETVPRKGLRIRSEAVSAAAPAPNTVTWPAERDRFVGRDRELAELITSEARLITVVGPGGIGKSRLVLRWLTTAGIHAVYADVDEARTVDGLLDRVTEALGGRVAGADRVAAVGRMLELGGSPRLVLDGFDSLGPWAEETVGRWLDRLPELRIVVTSRQRLGVRGEAALPLGPLSEDEAVALFDERARAANPRIVPSAQGSRELVGLLDRHPLAIELTAARVRTLSVDELRARLDDRHQLLGVRGGRPDRHATLRAVLDFDWERLDPATQAAVARLSVFEGGFSADAAERVIAAEDALEQLGALVDRSWIARDADRFSMSSIIRAYAGEKLAELGEDPRRDAERRHGRWAATLDQPGRFPGHAPPFAEQLRRERANLLVAAQRAMARGELDLAVAAVSASTLIKRGRSEPLVDLALALLDQPMPRPLRAYLAVATLRIAGRPRVAKGLRPHLVDLLPDADDTTAARLAYGLSELDRMAGRRSEAFEHASRSVALARSGGDPQTELVALALRVTFFRAGFEADIERGLALAREAGDGIWEQALLSDHGQAHVRNGELERAAEAYDQAARIHGGPVSEGVARLGHACCLSDLGRLDPAAFEAAIACFLHGPMFYEACARVNYAEALVDADRPEPAGPLIEAALHLFDPDDPAQMRWVRLVRARRSAALGDLAAARADHAVAARLLDPDARVHLVGAELHALGADWPGALDHARRAEAGARQTGSPIDVGRALALRARAERALGLDAAPAITELRTITERGGLGPEARLARELAALG